LRNPAREFLDAAIKFAQLGVVAEGHREPENRHQQISKPDQTQ
jgi:hypothetical protein